MRRQPDGNITLHDVVIREVLTLILGKSCRQFYHLFIYVHMDSSIYLLKLAELIK